MTKLRTLLRSTKLFLKSARRNVLLEINATIENDLNFANKKELKCKNNISIHKRLSQALSCLTFIIIGIPLGIKLRSKSPQGWIWRQFHSNLIFILSTGGNGNRTCRKCFHARDTCYMGRSCYPFYWRHVYSQKAIY